MEDAKATMDLYKVVAEEWEKKLTSTLKTTLKSTVWMNFWWCGLVTSRTFLLTCQGRHLWVPILSKCWLLCCQTPLTSQLFQCLRIMVLKWCSCQLRAAMFLLLLETTDPSNRRNWSQDWVGNLLIEAANIVFFLFLSYFYLVILAECCVTRLLPKESWLFLWNKITQLESHRSSFLQKITRCLIISVYGRNMKSLFYEVHGFDLTYTGFIFLSHV